MSLVSDSSLYLFLQLRDEYMFPSRRESIFFVPIVADANIADGKDDETQIMIKETLLMNYKRYKIYS